MSSEDTLRRISFLGSRPAGCDQKCVLGIKCASSRNSVSLPLLLSSGNFSAGTFVTESQAGLSEAELQAWSPGTARCRTCDSCPISACVSFENEFPVSGPWFLIVNREDQPGRHLFFLFPVLPPRKWVILSSPAMFLLSICFVPDAVSALPTLSPISPRKQLKDEAPLSSLFARRGDRLRSRVTCLGSLSPCPRSCMGLQLGLSSGNQREQPRGNQLLTHCPNRKAGEGWQKIPGKLKRGVV